MNRRMSFRLLALWAAVMWPADFKAQAADRKPNIIHIVSDELGYYELSCMGNPYLRTPNLDRMAAEGVRFTQALAGSSVCAPTRCCLMTGKHSGHTSSALERRRHPAACRRGNHRVGAEASRLRHRGIRQVGLWRTRFHRRAGEARVRPVRRLLRPGSRALLLSRLHRPQQRGTAAPRQPGRAQRPDVFPLRDCRRGDEVHPRQQGPSVLLLPPVTPPHGWFDIPDTDRAWALFKDKDWPEEAKRYAAMVNMVDRQVGELFALLKELGLDEQTIVFFSGDNGGADYFPTQAAPRGFHSANVDPKTGVFFRGKKGNLYEGGLRVPMLVRWPGKVKPGKVSDLLWYFPDVLPTVAELAGVPPPKDIDGLSIVPELLGEAVAGRKQPQHEFLYWELGPETAVRMGNWKAIRPRPNQAWQLYDLSKDISEQNNIAAGNPDVLAKLTAFAEKAHEPVQEGTFQDTVLHEKDRRAKFGETEPAAAKGKATAGAESLPTEDLIPSANWKIVRASSESVANQKFARNAIDGNPATHWHTQLQGELKKHPHELVVDLGAEHTVRGFRLPRPAGQRLERRDQGVRILRQQHAGPVRQTGRQSHAPENPESPGSEVRAGAGALRPAARAVGSQWRALGFCG